MNLKALAERKKSRFFVGRERECDEFQSFLRSDDIIFNIFGVGGVGKSTLLTQYLAICKAQHLPAALLDGKDASLIIAIVEGQLFYSAIKMLLVQAAQLCNESKHKPFFKAFYEEIDELKKLVTKLESMDIEEKGSSLASSSKEFIAQAAGGTIGAVVGNIPGAIVGAAIGTISGQIVEKIGRTMRNLRRYKLSKDEVELCLNAENRITKAFVHAVNQMAETGFRRVVLIFDTYEEMDSIDAWLRNVLLPELHMRIAIVISGRDPLSDTWNDWLESIRKYELKPFSPEDARKYLVSRGISNQDLVQDMVKMTGCLPWALTLVSEFKTSGVAAFDGLSALPSPGRQVVERFFSQVKDDRLRDVIEACSLTLTFDADLLEAMMKQDVRQQVEQLQHFSFVEVHKELHATKTVYRMALNDTFKEFVADKLRQERPSTMLQWNQRAVAFYEELLKIAPSHDLLPIYVWNYLHHRYFGDDEAYHLLFSDKNRQGSVTIKTATEADLQGILRVDWTAFTSPEDRFQIEQIVDLYHINPTIFTIARSVETGAIVGYSCIVPMKREFAIQFEIGTLDIQDVLAPTVLSSEEDPLLIDYMLDSLVLQDPEQLYIGALLIRHLERQLFRARKLYAIVSSTYGHKLMQKLKFKHIGNTTLNNNVVHGLYVCCLYDSTNPSPLVHVLPRESIDMPIVCKDCRYMWCHEWPGYAQHT